MKRCDGGTGVAGRMAAAAPTRWSVSDPVSALSLVPIDGNPIREVLALEPGKLPLFCLSPG